MSQPEAQQPVARVQLVVLSGLCVAGVGCARVSEEGGRPAAASLAVRSWSIRSHSALLMLAFLFLSAVFGLASGEIAFESIRRATYFVLGLAPSLPGRMLDARLRVPAVGDLIVGLRADPDPSDLRDALARALRDPSLTLAYWLPKFATYADLDGRPDRVAEPRTAAVR